MHTALGTTDLCRYVTRQLEALVPDPSVDHAAVRNYVPQTLVRLEACFSRINLKYFNDGGNVTFNHLHTDQYAAFLYLLANSIHRADGPRPLADAIYALNKALHGLDAYYEVELPEVFLLQHPVGTVLGRATYHDYFVAYQRVSVGSNIAGAYPVIGEGVVMFGGSTVIGASTIGSNCWLSVGTTVLEEDIAGASVVFGQSPKLQVKATRRDVRRDLFGIPA